MGVATGSSAWWHKQIQCVIPVFSPPLACPSAAWITTLSRSFCRLICFCHSHLLFLQFLPPDNDEHGGLNQISL